MHPARFNCLLLLLLGLLFLAPFSACQAADEEAKGEGEVVLHSLDAQPYMEGSRTIRVYLPVGYAESMQRYPVIYMLDGQNVFDPGGPYGSWSVDSLFNAMAAQGDRVPLVVGLDNSPQRMAEYTPWSGSAQGYAQTGRAEQTTLSWLLQTVKPFVDATYRTAPQREYTALGGSSLGGLTAMYGLLQHQDVFSKGLVFSPAYWINIDNVLPFVASWSRHAGNRFRIYQIGGTNEGANMTGNMYDVYSILTKQKGFSEVEILNCPSPMLQHNEASWRSVFGECYRWMWSDYLRDGVPLL